MIRAALIAGVVATVLVAPRTDEVSRNGLAFRDAADAPGAPGLSWTLPAGWHDVDRRLNALASPVPQLAAASFAVRRVRRDPDCRLDRVRAQIPARGALVLLLEDREAAARLRALARLPERRAAFGPPEAHECFGAASVVHWTEHGRSLMAVALFGRRAARGQANALLDSLVVRTIPPPPPPAGWRVVVSGAYDSIRVPPGWSAQAPDTAARPRTLFRLASHDGRVVVRVTELRRGHGRRFATRVFHRAGARELDRERARLATTTFGFARD
jgi:hypothetical protein